MRVLIIDTALGLCSAGVFEVVGDVARRLGLRSEAMTKGHQERLGGLVRDAVAEAGGFEGLERIGVTIGPGSFTGLRVGLAFAQGLGAALDAPIVGISTLDALAESVDVEAVAALIDARRGQVYARFWRDGAPLGDPAALDLQAAATAVQTLGDDAVLIGSGAVLVVPDHTLLIQTDGPDPAAIARLTARADPIAALARPLYLRAPDATPPTRLPGQARPARSA